MDLLRGVKQFLRRTGGAYESQEQKHAYSGVGRIVSGGRFSAEPVLVDAERLTTSE